MSERSCFRLPNRASGATSEHAGRSAKAAHSLLTPEIFMAQPLMPHATAAWLVENARWTFEQIAEFYLILEVQAIADDTAATKLTGRDPAWRWPGS